MFFIKQTLSGAHRKYSRGSSRSSSGHEETRKGAAKDEKIVYCSVLYSKDFILDEFKVIAANEDITKLTFEDMIERNDPAIMKAAKELLVETSHDDGHDKTLRGREIKHHRLNSNGDAITETVVKRYWEHINFIGCISTAEDYQHYLDKKHHFQSELNRLLAMKRMTLTLPIRFKTKLEIHSMLDLDSILQLLQDVCRDEHVVKVRFGPGLRVHHDTPPDKIAKKFMKMIDPKTMAWTGQPIHMFLRYGGEDLNVMDIHEIDIKKGKNKAALAPIRACAGALEQLINKNNNKQ